ncbi:hypothetical protein CLAFUW4_09912 [Fulvia fulva]|uniref:Heterokaryon incompatibility domain-containing protein n=1 Tax=Passalora fulva TaxID=5499 RepID=A0A9Q8PHV4_PASFU|nr:uncharacterized protein CLAFUR5_12328 [Fulvia fulva]KAK4615456.1 hypothetical protein CLAFUR4_09917 [Fulvia fulva]KAK4616767.1 hypothetical protein CLAFUR0_09911 [Fulvia fulva]UJO22755.1 hypothetical protein CLAFUR5_12328 [Fulvia fulva]WPV19505.1 hypothetical protein CLAFUW4_09912 [Fulvia fulva]WPV33767.1 hypothetical protein CLAFUW7_09914 [Fulvia fulva]
MAMAAGVKTACSLRIDWKDSRGSRLIDPKQQEALIEWGSKLSATEHEALQQLIDRPWFKRRWILQEGASSELPSTRVLLGDMQIPGESFMATLELTDLLQNVRAFRFTSTASRKGNILYNLQVFDEAQCSNPRDEIYALLNIAWTSPWDPREKSQGVLIDYTQTVEECYLLFARIKAQDPHDLIGIMACATSRPSSSISLPSWCPDWRVEIDYRSMRHQTACWRALDAVCHTADPRVIDSTLIVKGRILKPCPRVAKAQDFQCRDCSTCIFARAALRTKEGLNIVAILAKDEAEDDDTSLLLFDDCSIAFWVRPKIVFLPSNEEEEGTGSFETLYGLQSCVEVPDCARDCHYITRRGDLMPLVEVALC